jgi:broad specificity phosphatase PhoE
MRHAARESGPSGDQNWALTSAGRAEARLFGRNLPPFAHLGLTHTQLSRTEHTAREIAAGFRESRPGSRIELEGVDPSLSLTTFYSRDPALRDVWKRKLGPDFYHGWLEGELPPTAVAPVGEAVRDFVKRLHVKIAETPDSALLLGVTHDVYVLAIREVLFGRSPRARPGIGFLDGIILSRDGADHLVARWRGETVRIRP